VDQQLILILTMAQSSFYPQTAIPSDLALAHHEKYERAADRIVKIWINCFGKSESSMR
jgi:hypothetical protein